MPHQDVRLHNEVSVVEPTELWQGFGGFNMSGFGSWRSVEMLDLELCCVFISLTKFSPDLVYNFTLI